MSDYQSPTFGNAGRTSPGALGDAQTIDRLHLPSAEGLIDLLARQWRCIAVVAIFFLAAAAGYLLVTPTLHVSLCKLRVEPLGPQATQVVSGLGEGAGKGQISSEFLVTECDVITSNPVLALALSKIGPSPVFSGSVSPLEVLRNGLSAEVAKRGQTIVVGFESSNPREADRIVAAVVDAYQAMESDHVKQKVRESMQIITSGREQQRRDIVEKTRRMMELARRNGGAGEIDPDKNPVRAQIRSLAEAVTKAHLETLSARSAYEQSARAIAGDPAKLRQVETAARQIGYAANPSAQLTTIQNELFRQQARLLAAQKQYMPNHPVVKTIQSKIDQLIIGTVTAADQWTRTAQAKEDVLQKSLEAAQQASLEQETRAVEYSQLGVDIGQLKKMDEVLDGKLKEADLLRAGTSINVLNPPQVTGPPRPLRMRTLGLSLALGLCAGFVTACIRDTRGGRLRDSASVQKVFGTPVLGSIPAMLASFSAAGRGQVVNDDPFTPASEAYRTLQKTLVQGLPPRTRTLLVTSPVTGEGASTLVSNLAIAMAQANKRVLIIDANFRSPVQCHCFDLSDRAGLASVLAGDSTLKDAIQRTAIEGLDLLAGGRSDTAAPDELLNDPAFAENLNELADQYELVLIDAPAVLTANDARVIAASADATLLVVRPDASTRREAERARDGLRAVGARVIGVMLNAVHQAGAHLASTPQSRRTPAGSKPARQPTLRSERKQDSFAKP